MNKYAVFFTDGRQCEIAADKVHHYADGIEFINKEDSVYKEVVAWFNPKAVAGYAVYPNVEEVRNNDTRTSKENP